MNLSIYFCTIQENQVSHGGLEEYQCMQCGTIEISYHELPSHGHALSMSPLPADTGHASTICSHLIPGSTQLSCDCTYRSHID